MADIVEDARRLLENAKNDPEAWDFWLKNFGACMVGEIVKAREERDKFKKFYDMAIEQHMGLGEEMTLRRHLKEAEAEIQRLKEKLVDHGTFDDDGETVCGICGATMEFVRPGKHQPLCDCYD
jgi:hypothetical protein